MDTTSQDFRDHVEELTDIAIDETILIGDEDSGSSYLLRLVRARYLATGTALAGQIDHVIEHIGEVFTDVETIISDHEYDTKQDN